MKRMKYCGTYVNLPGDVFVFHNNGISIITERELKEKNYKCTILCKQCYHKDTCEVKWYIFTCKQYKLEDKKMSNYFMLDGKRIPMSNETAKSLREEQPVKWKFGDTADSYSDYTGTRKRILLYDKNGNLNWFSLMGNQVYFHSDAIGYAKTNYYIKTGNVFQGE